MYLRLFAAIILFAILASVLPALHIGETPLLVKQARAGPTVYVGGSGSFYHTAFCPDLGGTHYAMPLDEAKHSGYGACPKCGGGAGGE